MKFSCFAFILVSLLSVGLFAQVNPVPTINGPVSPQAVVPGSGAFTLTVRGAGFVPGAVVNWNGAARTTTFISAGELQAQILASDVALAGGSLVTVTNPPPGGGLSSSSFGMVEIHQPILKMVLAQPHTYAGREKGTRVFTADLNGDNKLDLIQLGVKGFAVLLGNGDGTFTRSAARTLNTNPLGFSFGDFNGDGKEDLVYVLSGGTQAVVALGDGTGKFQELPGFGNFTNPVQTAVGDFYRDGILDLVVAAQDGFYILLGNGDGTFQPQQGNTSFFQPYDFTPADFNGDGILDLAFFDTSQGLVAVLLGYGDGSFQPPLEMQPA